MWNSAKRFRSRWPLAIALPTMAASLKSFAMLGDRIFLVQPDQGPCPFLGSERGHSVVGAGKSV
jgi:hypothetical protein